jgi:hypothetical protein
MVVVLSLLVAACGPTPTPTHPSPQAMLESALAALEEESYHVEMDMLMTMRDETGTLMVPIAFIGDFQAPDRLQGTMSQSYGEMTIEFEFITIAETTYVKSPETGEWKISTEQTFPFSTERFISFEPADIEDPAIVGEETLNGDRVYHLTGFAAAREIVDAFAFPFTITGGELQLEYWIGVNDGRVRQNAVYVLLLLPGRTGDFIRLTGTTTYSDFGRAVTIVPPELSP